MKNQSAINAVALFLCLAPCIAGQERMADEEGPRLVRCSPLTISVGTVVDIEGYRLGANEPDKVQVVFAQGNFRRAANRINSSYMSNNPNSGVQHLWVSVPEGLATGECQLSVEIGGRSSAPMLIEIGEWVPPVITKVSPHWVQSGESVSVYGSGFNTSDEVELVDVGGQPHRLEAGHHAKLVSFTLPDRLPEGQATVRIVNPRAPDEIRSNSLSLTVSRGPVPLDLWPECLESVAPGQWMHLEATTLRPLEHADGAQAAFRQRGKVLMSSIAGRQSALVRVPTALMPGDVELMTRTWQGGETSAWSEPVPYTVLDKPVPPSVAGIEVGEADDYVSLAPGPDRPPSFLARPGQTLTLVGAFHVVSGDRIEVQLAGPAGTVTLKSTLLPDRSAIRIELPADLPTGAWRIALRCLDDGGYSTAAITMFVEVGLR